MEEVIDLLTGRPQLGNWQENNSEMRQEARIDWSLMKHLNICHKSRQGRRYELSRAFLCSNDLTIKHGDNCLS